MLTEAEKEVIHRLWDRISAFSAWESDSALLFLMEELCRGIRADDALWVGGARLLHGSAARRDAQYGWRGVRIRHLRLTPEMQARSIQAAKEQDSDPGMTTRALVAGAGAFRVHRLHDGFVDIKRFKASVHYRLFYQEAGIVDRLFVGVPLTPDAESFLIFDRLDGASLFAPDECEYLAYAMRGLKRFHRDLMLSHGLLCGKTPLSPTERRITQMLLTDCPEKEIAAALGQSPKTTHKYITEILRKFGVKGRAGLMSLWLSGV